MLNYRFASVQTAFFESMTIPKQTVEARWYLGCVLYSLMYHYVLGRAKACLPWDAHAPEDAVADNADKP